MKWEILILTQPSRKQMLTQLLELLTPQCDGYDVAVRVCQFKPELSLGANREFYRQQCQAEYHNWIDDDDLVAANYVSRIFPLLDGVDCIGYKVKMLVRGNDGPMAIHSLRYPGWNTVAGWNKKPNVILERDIVHFNPMRTELALQFPMEGGRGEDERWARGLKALGVVKTEHFIDEVMHYYLWRKPKNDAMDWKQKDRLALIEKLKKDARVILPACRRNVAVAMRARAIGLTPEQVLEHSKQVAHKL